MANTTISPNMNMPVPTVGVDPAPDWATNVVSSLSIIDSHTHTSGQGVPITPAAININADLPMNGYNLTTARTFRFDPQSSTPGNASDIGCLVEIGVDLYYIDGAGNLVRITQGGSVTGASGTITGLPSGTASASYSAGTFTFQSATNTPATLNVGTIVLGQLLASGKNVTIAASGSQASNYNLTLPIALPSVQAAPVSDTSGNLSFLPLQGSTYTPTISTTAGGSGFGVSGPFMYLRVDNIVHVAGKITYTASQSTSSWRITLPVARTDGNFTQAYQAVGNLTENFTGPTLQLGSAEAVASTQTVVCSQSVASGNNNGVARIQFTYVLTNV